MKTLLRTKGTHTSFIIADLDPAYSEVVQALEYEEMDAGFAKTYPANTPHLASIFRHFSRCAEEMILQAADVHPVPWEEALLTFLERTERQDVSELVAGRECCSCRTWAEDRPT